KAPRLEFDADREPAPSKRLREFTAHDTEDSRLAARNDEIDARIGKHLRAERGSSEKTPTGDPITIHETVEVRARSESGDSEALRIHHETQHIDRLAARLVYVQRLHRSTSGSGLRRPSIASRKTMLARSLRRRRSHMSDITNILAHFSNTSHAE